MSASADSESHGSSRALARSSAVMASGTLVSRLLGLVRMALLAGAIGILTPAGNIWETANTIPNIIFLLLAAGVLNVLLLPQLTRAMTRGEEGQDYSDRLLTLALTVLVAGTLLFWLATPLVVKLLALSWPWGSPDLSLAILFAYFCLPQMLFYGLHTTLGQVLAAHHRFAAYMWSPALANVVQIAGIMLFTRLYPGVAGRPEDPGAGIAGIPPLPPEEWTLPMVALLGGSATLGIVVQALVLVPAVRATGFRWRPRWGFRGVGLGVAGVMALWAFAEVALSQGGMLLVSNLLNDAVYAQPDAPGRSAYFAGFSIFMLPHSIIALSLLTAMYPVLSKAAAAGDLRAMAARTETGLRTLASVMVPIAVGMLVLAPLVVRVVYFRSEAPTHDAITAIVLAFTLGLVPYGIYLLCSRVFYSFEDARTPFFFQVGLSATLLLAVVVGFFTVPPGQVAVTAALGQALGQVVAMVLALRAVRRRLPDIELASLGSTLVRALAAAAVALLPAWGIIRLLDRPGTVGAIVALGVAGVVFLAVYGILALVLGVGEVRQVIAPLLRRVPALRRLAPAPGQGDLLGAAAGAPTEAEAGPQARPETGMPGSDEAVPAAGSRPWPGTASPTPGASQGTLGWDDAPDAAPTGGEDSDMDRLEEGTVLGERYALEELLAERDGGGLQYWSARDVTLGRLVALTALPSHGDDATIAQAVLDGARRVASVDDPRLVRVLDVGDEDGLCWIVEEGLTEAESLASLVEEHPLPAEEARRMVGEAAAGLESARRRGLHHLYLNPHSVLRTTDGTVKVSGVGVASALEGTDDVTADEASLIDTADLVSLLYTGLTGRWPGEDLPGVRAARRLADDTLPAPSELVSGVPGDLDALCRLVHGAGADLSVAPHTPGELGRQLSPWSSEMVHGPRPGDLSAPRSDQDRDRATDALSGVAGASAAANPTRAQHPDDQTTAVPQAYYRTGNRDQGPDRDQSRDDTGEMSGLLASGERAADEADRRRADGGRGREQHAAAAVGGAGVGGAGARAGGADPRPADQLDDDGTPLREERSTGLQNLAVVAVIVGILAGVLLLGWALLRGLGTEDGLAGPQTTPAATQDEAGAPGAADPGEDAVAVTDDAPQTDAADPAEGEGAAAPEAGGPGADGTVAVLGITSFDPQGDGDERNDLAPLAVDGDPETAWTSHTYLSAGWGSLKDGTGLILDLGDGATVSEVEVQLGEGDMGTTLYLSESPGLEGATELGSEEQAEGTWTVAPEAAASGRYLILWFDRAASTDDGEVASVREITVR